MPERKLYPGSAQIIDLARARADRPQARRPRRPARSPRFVLTVSLLSGLAIGLLVARLHSGGELAEDRDGSLLAHGRLSQALDQQLTGRIAADTAVRVTATYRAHTGGYCRAFTLTGAQSLSGLACRNGMHWQIQTLLSGGAANSALLDLNRFVSGTPLTPAAETQLRSRDWKQ